MLHADGTWDFSEWLGRLLAWEGGFSVAYSSSVMGAWILKDEAKLCLKSGKVPEFCTRKARGKIVLKTRERIVLKFALSLSLLPPPPSLSPSVPPSLICLVWEMFSMDLPMLPNYTPIIFKLLKKFLSLVIV